MSMIRKSLTRLQVLAKLPQSGIAALTNVESGCQDSCMRKREAHQAALRSLIPACHTQSRYIHSPLIALPSTLAPLLHSVIIQLKVSDRHGKLNKLYMTKVGIKCFRYLEPSRVASYGRGQPQGFSQSIVCRTMVASSKLKPKFQGGKLKLRSAYKERFKALSDGTIKIFPSGFRHRRFRKGNTQRRRLKLPHSMHQTYANTLRRMGFK